jgi:WD40 repeat protein/serine/threonine protein kinase
MEFCPVCMLREALAGGVESGESSFEESVEPTLEKAVQRFEHYDLVTGEDGKPVELGRGAMGVTYKAFDVDLRCPVTLKVISERYLGDESARLRFLREARAAASVRHPNVASVFHLGRTGENYFYAMEFVAGETLANLIKRLGRLEGTLALEIATQVTAGLAAVHEQNIVHRDIKPTNIMVKLKEERSVTAKIIDLGLAKTLNDSASEAGISSPGVFAGTPEFASPEQFAGVGVDIRSDLYSLGVTLWEMLIGRAPFRGSSVELMYQHQRAPLPIEQLNGIPQPLVVLLEVLLAKDPVRRFQTPAELLKVMPTVREAINAGHSLTKTIRVFVSSTGDVQKERHVAERVMRSIAAEFNLPVSASYSIFQRLAEEEEGPENGTPKTEPDNHSRLILCPYFLEHQRLKLDAGYQGAIPNTAEFGLVICILWSRLGTLLDPALRMPDGSAPHSGTDYEIGLALDHAGKNRGVPQLRVYRNCSTPTPPLEPKEEREVFIRQWDSLQQFFADWEKKNETNFNGTWNNYQNLEEFEELFRGHFRDFLGRQVDQETGQKLLSRKVRRWKSSPFRGLNVFDFEHAPIFHGRTRAIGEVLEALEGQVRAQRPFVLIVGASGSGKSSLVRAGVLRLLTQPGTIEGVGFWRWSITRPGAGGSGGDCFDALAAALLEPTALPTLADPESRNAVHDLGSELREHSDSVALRVRDALDHAAREWKIQRCHSLEEKECQLRASGRSDDADVARQQRERFELPKARLALVVDQLEELFTTGFSSEVRQKYISALAGLVRSGRVFVLATLRNDFYASYQEFPELIELTKPGGKFDLRPPTPAEIGNMIRLPAEAAGLHFEQDRETGQRLDDALRDAASATPESLPLLEHVLSLLYEQQSVRGDDLMRWSDYRELGELKGALAKYAEAVFSTLGSDDQRAFPLVMRHLVTLGQGEEEVPNRRTVPYRDFATEGIDERAGAKGFVDLFIEKRLLVADTDPQGEVTVCVAHEALLREWVRVKSWLAENREFLRMRDRLDSSLRLWVSRGKQKDDLLGPGLPVAEGERLVKEFQMSLSGEEIDYIKASAGERKRREQARARQFQVAAAVLFVLLCAASIGAYFGFTGRVEAEKQKQDAVAKNRELGSLLEEASWASFNQAERQFHLGQWNEGIALLARAVKFDPKNEIASERFFRQLIQDRWKVTTPLATFQHEGDVTSAVFSPDGARILTASADRTARLWDGGSGSLLATFQQEGPVSSAVFSPDGARILTASWDKTARLWDGRSGKLLATFQQQSGVNSAVFSPDGARILTVSADNTARLWDGGSGQLLTTFQHEGPVTSAVFSPDGARILTACWDRTARLWDGGAGKLLASFQHEGPVNSAVFSPDGARILTASWDYTARLWDGGSGQLLATFQHESEVRSAVFSPDGARILTASWDKTTRLWDGGSGKLLATFQHEGPVNSAVFSPDGARILTASADRTARLWDGGSGKLLASFQNESEVRSAVFSPGGTRILTVSADRTARLWDGGSGQLLATFQHEGEVNFAVFSPDGARILTASADRTARLWDRGSGKLLATFQHKGEVRSAVFSPDGTRILTAGADRTAWLWDGDSGKLLATFQHEGEVTSAVFSPDGTRILTASADRTARLWDGGSGKLLATFQHEGEVRSAVFSPDGARILAASADRTARLWDGGSGKLLATFRHEGPVRSAVFSPDGTRILTASADRTARLWDGGSGKLLATFQHEGDVTSAVFSLDGVRILTASADNTARLWDGGSGKPLASFQHEGDVTSAVFSPDGARILTASADRTARLWDGGSGKLLATFQHERGVTSAAQEKSWLTHIFGATFQHESEVSSAVFSPDGARILTVSRDKTARLWDATIARSLARLMVESQALRRVGLLSELASGLEISEDGSLTAIPSGRRFELVTQVRDSAKDDELMSRFIRWFCSPIEERTIFPDSKMNNATWLDNQIVSIPSVPESLATNAFEAFPSRPLPELAMAKYAEDSAGADFLRSQALKRLPKDGAICTKAGEMLRDQRRPYMALEAADKALAVDTTALPAHRLRAACLTDLNRSEDALQEWQVIMARPDAASTDFAQAGYLAAKVGKSDLCNSIFGQGRGCFPKDPDLRVYHGWAMLNLHRNTEAVAAFETSEQLLASGENPSSHLLAGQAAANWAAGRKDNAVAVYVRLITVGQGNINWADSTAVAKADLTNAEKQPLLEALAETLRQLPELAPQEIAITSAPTDPPGESIASEPIKGTVGGVNPQDYKVVIYARSGDQWRAQPTAASPQTQIGNDGKWESETHGGTEFAALLVKASYQPEATRGTIPGVGGDVIAVAKKKP